MKKKTKQSVRFGEQKGCTSKAHTQKFLCCCLFSNSNSINGHKTIKQLKKKSHGQNYTFEEGSNVCLMIQKVHPQTWMCLLLFPSCLSLSLLASPHRISPESHPVPLDGVTTRRSFTSYHQEYSAQGKLSNLQPVKTPELLDK